MSYFPYKKDQNEMKYALNITLHDKKEMGPIYISY